MSLSILKLEDKILLKKYWHLLQVSSCTYRGVKQVSKWMVGAKFLTVREEEREEGQNKPCSTGIESKILLESKT